MDWILVALFLAFIVWYFVFCFTNVKEGTAKIVVRFDGYIKTLLCKKGHKIDENGEVVQLKEDELPQYPDFLGGLRWVSLLKPLGIDKILVKNTRFIKTLSNGKFEKQTEKTNFILVNHYQYGLEFNGAEDKNGLPLSGKMTMTAMITNPFKSSFCVRDWFDALISRVLPCVRNYISKYSYEELINRPDVKLDTDVFRSMNMEGSKGEPSIASILQQEYGITLMALETINIDPPEGYREATVAKWKAQQTATKETEETVGRILLSVATEAGIEIDMLKAKLNADPSLRGKSANEGGFKEAFDYARDLVKRDRAGSGLTDVRVGNADGTKLDPATAAIVTLLSLLKENKKEGKNPKGEKDKQKDPKDMTDEESLDNALND